MSKMFIAALLLTGTVGLRAQSAFQSLPSGLKYHIVEDKKAPRSKYNDIMQLSFSMSYVQSAEAQKDSLLFSTSQKGFGPIQITLSPAQFHGDFMEGLTLLGKGDSAEFLSPCDSMIKNQRPPFARPGGYMMMKVRVMDHMTKEEFDAKQKEEAMKQVKADEDQILAYAKSHNLKVQKTASGLYYEIEQQGNGLKIEPGDTLKMNYTGMTTNDHIFDSNVKPEYHHVEPFQFIIGRGQVIKGWDEGVALFNGGGKGKLLIPSGLGYGSRGAGNDIPPNAVLIFDVEVLSVGKPKK